MERWTRSTCSTFMFFSKILGTPRRFTSGTLLTHPALTESQELRLTSRRGAHRVLWKVLAAFSVSPVPVILVNFSAILLVFVIRRQIKTNNDTLFNGSVQIATSQPVVSQSSQAAEKGQLHNQSLKYIEHGFLIVSSFCFPLVRPSFADFSSFASLVFLPGRRCRLCLEFRDHGHFPLVIHSFQAHSPGFLVGVRGVRLQSRAFVADLILPRLHSVETIMYSPAWAATIPVSIAMVVQVFFAWRSLPRPQNQASSGPDRQEIVLPSSLGALASQTSDAGGLKGHQYRACQTYSQ